MNNRQTWVNYSDGDKDTYEGTMPLRDVKSMFKDDPNVASIEYVFRERVNKKFVKADMGTEQPEGTK